jgi:hypothetical protein
VQNEDRDRRIKALASGPVLGALMWVDPSGQMWIAPLGSPDPDPDRAMPASWIPVKRNDEAVI